MQLATKIERLEVGVEIGGLPIALCCEQASFVRMVEHRYANFLCRPDIAVLTIDVTLTGSGRVTDEEDIEVREVSGGWLMRRADFEAHWDPALGRGSILLSDDNPFALDTMLRIVHGLVLARNSLMAGGGGFLLHSASAIRNGRGFLFSGVSGAGKTTISRMAPPDAILLTDEMSYVRRDALTGGYSAFGTPFAGDLGVAGANVSAPLAALYFLVQGPENKIGYIAPEVAARKLLRNVLFFADNSALTSEIFRLGCDFVTTVPCHELMFRAEPSVWDLIK